MRSKQYFFSVGVGIVLFLMICSMNVRAFNPLQFSLDRTDGYQLNNDIQGHFELTVTSPSNLVLVQIYFNDTSEANLTTSPFSWAFDTDNYSLGVTNITVIGYDASNNTYQGSSVLNFVSSSVNIPYDVLLVVVLAIASVLIVFSIRRKLKKKPIKSDNVNINLDKDLL